MSDIEANGKSLERRLTVIDGVSMIVGLIIGTGIFASPGVIVKLVQQVGVCFLAWITGGILAMVGGLCFAELGTVLPDTGGEYVYLNEMHAVFGYSFLWACFFCIKTGSMSVIALIFSRYLSSIILGLDGTDELDSNYRVKLLAIAAIVGVAGLNILGTEWVAKVQRLFFVTKILAIVFVCCVGLYSVTFGDTQEIAKENFKNIFYVSDNIEVSSVFSYVAHFGSAVVAALWAYDGFDSLNIIGGEMKNPQKSIPIAIFVGMCIVILCYLAANVAYFLVLPMDVLISSQAVAITISNTVWGKWAGMVIAILVSFSALGSLNVSLMGGSRIIYAGAVDDTVPFSSYLKLVSQDFGTPYAAVLLQATMSVLLLIPGNFETLINYLGFASWIFYGLCAISLMYIRIKKTHLVATFKVRPFPIVPILFVIASTGVILSTLVENPMPTFYASLFLLSGLPVFYLFFWRGNLLKQLYYKLTSKNQPSTDIVPEQNEVEIEIESI